MTYTVVGRLHKVNFELDSRKHTVYFAEHAAQATLKALEGWASPGHARAHLGATEEVVIEGIRKALLADIEHWMPGCDLTAFSFNVAFEKIDEEGTFWTDFRCVVGNKFKVHEFNEWGG